MKARLTYSDIATGLDAVKPAVTSSRPFIRLATSDDGMAIVADDLNVAITARIPSWAPMGDDVDGEAVVPFRPLREFLAAVGDDLELVLDGDRLTVANGATRIDLATADAVDFPQRPEVADAEVSVTLDAGQWAQVRSLVPFAATDASLGARTGVNFFADCAVATDGFVLGLVRHDFGFEVTVPAGVIDAVGKDADEVSLAADGRSMRLEADGVVVRTSRIADSIGDFWRQMFTVEPTASLTVGVEDLESGVAVARIPARVGIGGGKDLVLRFDEDRVAIESWPDETAGTGDVARYPLASARFTGVDWTVMGLQERWIGTPLKLVGADDDGEVTFAMTGPNKPVIIDRGTVAALLMPLQRPPK